MTEVLIKAENVSKKFCRDFKRSLWYGMKDIGRSLLGQDHSQDELRKDEFWAVKDINFEVRRGECLGLIGHNGAGKSTLLKMLNGLINPDQGKITMRGRIGALIELGAGFNPLLTGRENIYNNGAVLGFTKQEIKDKLDSIIEFSEIGEFINAPVQNYSSGMKVRLGFAVAAQMEPDILLIDEVLAVGDLGFIIKCMNRVHELMKNTAVIFVSHSMPFVARLCTSIMLLKHGKTSYFSNETNLVINEYLKLFNNGQERLVGLGKGRVLSKKLLNNKTEKIDTINHGDNVIVNLRLNIDHNIDTFQIRLIIFNLQQRPIIDYFSGLNNDPFKNPKKDFTIVTELKKLTLTQGKYTFAIVVFNHEGVLCRIDNTLEFTIKSTYASFSETFQNTKWRILENV